MANTSVISSKPNTKIQPAAPKNDAGDEHNRVEMISVAACHRAGNRNFVRGDPLADWLSAESEIYAMHQNHEGIKALDQAN